MYNSLLLYLFMRGEIRTMKIWEIYDDTANDSMYQHTDGG